MNIPSIECHKKTGDGPDALYVLVTWKTKHGQIRSVRLPNDGHYTITDSQHPDLNGAPASLDLGTIVGFDLAADDYIDVLCSFMVQDGGTASQYNEVGVQVAKLATSPGKSIYQSVTSYIFKNILANVAKKFLLSNPDDWIGSCSYRITRPVTGQVHISFKQVHNPNSSGGYAQAASTTTQNEKKPIDAANANEDFSFTGDGSSYGLRVTVSK